MLDDRRINIITAFLVATIPVLAASFIGSSVTLPVIPTWYAGLVKPSFNPPNWLFGPVWTMLYLMMGTAFFRILRLPVDKVGRGTAIQAFLFQIAMNALWSIAFFGLQNIIGGIVVVVLLWLGLAATIVIFWKLDRIAAWLMVPCIFWVSFAAVLNTAIYMLN
jgi:tryptophan-rich sensory protein